MSSRLFFVTVLIVLLFSSPLLFMAMTGQELGSATLALILICMLATGLLSAWAGSLNPARPRQGRTGKPQKRTSPPPSKRSKENEREGGIVKWFNASKGFGFITRDSGDDVFVHFRSIRGEGHRVLRDGQRVEFEVSQGDKGLQAEDVSPAH